MFDMKRTTPIEQLGASRLGRRTLIKCSLLQAVALGIGHFSSKAISSDSSELESNMGMIELISTLRGMKKAVCDTAAQSIETSLWNGSDVSLHLRNADLDVSDTLLLAKALQNLSDSSDSAHLSSFSVSYNRKLGDRGTVALAQALPLKVQEIGFVDCNMRDEGAIALLAWAKRSSNLKMICIEQNNFSADTRSLYQVYQRSHPGASVYL